jgi:ribosomal protein S27E
MRKRMYSNFMQSPYSKGECYVCTSVVKEEQDGEAKIKKGVVSGN